MRNLFAVSLMFVAGIAFAQSSPAPSKDVLQYIKVSEPAFALVHVRVIDGTGAPARDDQTIIVSQGRVQSVGPAVGTNIPASTKAFDYTGYTVFPGMIGMHDHLYYTASSADQRSPGHPVPPPGLFVNEIPFSAPRLYLAAGVTTIRTTGNVDGYTDLRVKRLIDSNQMPGPKVDASAPYLEGSPTYFAQMHELTGPDDATRLVNYWADEGATSFKAYMNITRAELAAAVNAAHARHSKITGHLCSVTWPEAIASGIDDLEHGPVFADSEFVEGKQPDVCESGKLSASWMKVDMNGPAVKKLINDLVTHHVAVTSTLPVFEAMVPNRPQLEPRVLNAMSPAARLSYLTDRGRISPQSPMTELFKREMQFEYEFAKAGGLLLGGPDPTGNGGTLPGFGDQREAELLVEAGFTPLEAIQVMTENGARYLGQQDRIGTIAAGKQADLVLVKGDPSKNINDIENVEVVFKDGVGYDSLKLIDAVKGQVGIH